MLWIGWLIAGDLGRHKCTNFGSDTVRAQTLFAKVLDAKAS